MRFFCIACTVLFFAATTSSAQANNKYAGLVVDADTGEVLYQENAGARRFPASLTKMMTAYLLFDELRKGKISTRTRMRASKKAASQPQTNISLKPGDTITVDQAIRALVVRSANDVAIVVAEHLGGSERNFAQRMTNTARSLGMRGTAFKNPHGLPNSKQYTTAKDMAKLGIALRRDFPQYYAYFKETEFRWKGKTYKSHNSVLKEYGGVDGIKTGYIRASGFNLVSSAKRDGYNVVAVVMGGKSSSRRDEHMKELLDRNFTKLAARGNRPRIFAKAPKPSKKPITLAQATQNAPFAKAQPASAVQKDKAVNVASLGNNVIRFVPSKKPITASQQNNLSAQLERRKNSAQRGSWAIQVGAFSGKQNALEAASEAIQRAKGQLADARIAISGSGALHRAQIANLTKREARKACQTLRQYDSQCFSFQDSSL